MEEAPRPVITLNDNLEVPSKIITFAYYEAGNVIGIGYSSGVVDIYRDMRRLFRLSHRGIRTLQISESYFVTLDTANEMRIYSMSTGAQVKMVEHVAFIGIYDEHLFYTHTRDQKYLEGIDYSSFTGVDLARSFRDGFGVVSLPKNRNGSYVQKKEIPQTWQPSSVLGIIFLERPHSGIDSPVWLYLGPKNDFVLVEFPSERSDILNVILYQNSTQQSITIHRDLAKGFLPPKSHPYLRDVTINSMFNIRDEIFCEVSTKRNPSTTYLQVFTKDFAIVRGDSSVLISNIVVLPFGDFLLMFNTYKLSIVNKIDFSTIKEFSVPPLAIMDYSYDARLGRHIALVGADFKTRIWDVEDLMRPRLPPVRQIGDRPIYARKLGNSRLADYKVFIWGEGLTRVRPYLERMKTYPYREIGGEWHDDGSVALIKSEPGKRGYNNERREVTGNNYFIENFAPISDRAHMILKDLISIANDVWPEDDDDEQHTVRPLALHPNRRGAPGPPPPGPPRGNGRPPPGPPPPGPPPFGAAVAAAVPAGGAGGPSGPSLVPSAASSAPFGASAAPAASSGVVSALLGAFGASAAPAPAAPGGASAASAASAAPPSGVCDWCHQPGHIARNCPFIHLSSQSNAIRYAASRRASAAPGGASAAPGGASAAAAPGFNRIRAIVPINAMDSVISQIGDIQRRLNVEIRAWGLGPLRIEIIRTAHPTSDPNAALVEVERIVRGAAGGPSAVTGIVRTGGRRRLRLPSRKHKKAHHHKSRSRKVRHRRTRSRK